MHTQTGKDETVATCERLAKALRELKHDPDRRLELAEYEHFASVYGGRLSELAGQILCDIAESRLNTTRA